MVHGIIILPYGINKKVGKYISAQHQHPHFIPTNTFISKIKEKSVTTGHVYASEWAKRDEYHSFFSSSAILYLYYVNIFMPLIGMFTGIFYIHLCHVTYYIILD